MTRPTDAQLFAFLQGELDADEREAVLSAIERSPDLASELRAAAGGVEAMQAYVSGLSARVSDPGSGRAGGMGAAKHGPASTSDRYRRRRVPAWWVPAAAAAAVTLAVPATLLLAPSRDGRPSAEGVDRLATAAAATVGAPTAPDPSFVLILQGRWPDAGTLDPSETRRRADEYWGWTTDLAERDLLVAAGDLRWEPGVRLASSGDPLDPPADAVAQPDFVVGMLTVRASTYDEALALAEECPHLRYGGSVSVRRVGGGFVTVPGMDDWSE